MSNPSKPAWGSYADLKRIQRERERTATAPTPLPLPTVEPPATEAGPVETGHPQTGHPIDAIPGTHEPGTQSPTNRAPGHPQLGARVPELRAPNPDETGHPGTHKPGTQKAPFRAPTNRESAATDPSVEPRESPYWPSRQYKTRLNLRFPGDLAQLLDAYCRTHGLSKQDAAEIAIRRLIADDRIANRAPGHPQTGHPQTGHPQLWVPESAHDHDDDDDDRIIIYQQMTGNRINARDRAAFREVRHLHTDVIREGIRLSLERAPSPVKSLRYCLGAILEVAAKAATPPAPPPIARGPEPDGAPARTRDETVMLARAVIRELRHETPEIDPSALRSSLHAWCGDQGVADANGVIELAFAAEGIAQ